MIIRIDYACDRTFDELVNDLARWTSDGISYRCIEERGPGGGNPLFELEGDRVTLERALASHLDGDSIDVYKV